jgi:TetR/AcrR family transcriptional repressor of nem operon
MAGSVTPEVLAQPDLRQYIEGQISTLAAVLTDRFCADKQAGLLVQDFDPQLVVSVIITYLQGIWRMALVSYDRSRFEQQIHVFLTGLGL